MYTILNSSIRGTSRRRVTRNDANEQINKKDCKKSALHRECYFLLISLPKFSSAILGLLAGSIAMRCDAFAIAKESGRREEKEEKKRRYILEIGKSVYAELGCDRTNENGNASRRPRA